MFMKPPHTPHPTPTGPSPRPLPGLRLVHTVVGVWQWAQHRPWLAAIPLMVMAAVLTGRSLLHRRHARLAGHPSYVAITPPAKVDPAGAGAWWANLHELLRRGTLARLMHGAAHLGVEYRWTGRQLTIGVWVPGTVAAGPVAAAARAAWPGTTATIIDVSDPIPATARVEGGALVPRLPAWYPLSTGQDVDPMRAVIAAVTGLHDHERACVQVLARPATPRQIARLRRGAGALRTGHVLTSPLDPKAWLRGALDLLSPATGRTGTRARPPGDPLRERDGREALDKAADIQWEVAIRYAVADTRTDDRSGEATKDRPRAEAAARVVTLAHALAAAYGLYQARNTLRRVRVSHLAAVLAARPLRLGFLLATTELAAIAGLPLDLAVPGLERARARAVPAPVAVAAGGRGMKVLGRAEAGGHSVALSVVDARQHVHLLGSTGSGKSTLMTRLILDDIRCRRGVVVIDPKGDLVSDILERLPASDEITGRLTVIDPDQDGGATFNPLEGDDPDLVVDNVVSIFSTIFAKHWGPRMDDVLRVACLTLLRKANATLPNVPPLLNDRQFRAPFTVDLDDPAGLRGFWEWYEAAPLAMRAQVVGAVESRLRQFLVRPFVRATLSAPRSSFDMARVLDGGILLARLPKGQLGDDAARIMGSFVFARVWQAATARARIPEDRRRDACCYVDEAHNVLNLAGSVTDMLAEARGYHLSLVLAHQHLGQLPRDTQLALSANARNKIYFSCSPEDAHQLARHTTPELDDGDLAHLGDYTAAARLVVNNRTTAAFTLRTHPPVPPLGESTAVRQAIARPVDEAPSALEELARRSAENRRAKTSGARRGSPGNESGAAGR